jgi:hypothetical protein
MVQGLRERGQSLQQCLAALGRNSVPLKSWWTVSRADNAERYVKVMNEELRRQGVSNKGRTVSPQGMKQQLRNPTAKKGMRVTSSESGLNSCHSIHSTYLLSILSRSGSWLSISRASAITDVLLNSHVIASCRAAIPSMSQRGLHSQWRNNLEQTMKWNH